MDNQNTAHALYEKLAHDRNVYLNRARDAALVTIPYLVPPEGADGNTTYATPWQSMGARGVNNLAAKLLLALLPPNTPFFRLNMADFVKGQVQQSPEMKNKIEAGLSAVEREVMQDIETGNIRVSLFETLKHLLVSGSALAYLPRDGGMKLYKLQQFVVLRNGYGVPTLIVIKEEIERSTLSDDVRALVDDKYPRDGAGTTKAQDKVCVYTRVELRNDFYHVTQELKNGEPVPGSKGLYPKDKTPFLALRWAKIDGENYGRSHVEEYFGDLQSLDGLTKAIVEGSAIAAKVVLLVDPNGTTDADDINKAENGEAVPGKKEEVTAWQCDKYADFRVAMETATRLERRLEQAFLLTSSVQRDAERVTAEEIRIMAGELENSLGGVYSILSQEFQLPFLRRIMARMEAGGKLPKLPSGTVKPTITTGLEALGRNSELSKYITFTRILTETLGQDAVMQVLMPGEFSSIIGTQIGIDTTRIVKSDKMIAQENAVRRRQETINQLGPEAMRAAAAQQQQPA